jgi:SSS family transporter
MTSWIGQHGIILFLLAGYLAVLAQHAIAGKRRTKGLADYYVGGRSMGGVALGISFFATYSSTNSFIGFAGQTYSYGLPWLLFVPVITVFCFVAWRWVAPRLREATASLDSVTIPDFIGFRFGSNAARFSAALIVVFASLLYMTAVFKGAGTLLETFLDIPYAGAIGLVLVIVMLYTAVGGFISVVKTDVVQGVIMVLAAILLFVGTVRAAGGLDTFAAVRELPEGRALFSWDAAMPFPVLFGIMVAGTFKLVVEPRQLSRFYALRTPAEARQGLWVSTLIFLFAYSLLLPLGIYARHLFPAGMADTDRIIPEILSGGVVFHPAVGAFLVLALIAAAMSSLDSVLLVLASTCERDIVGVWRGVIPDAAAIRATRWYVAVFAAITGLIALNPPGGIVALTAFSGSLYTACFFPALILGLYWKKGNGAAVLASFAAGVLTLALWRYVPAMSNVHAVFPAVLFSTGAYAVIAARVPLADPSKEPNRE